MKIYIHKEGQLHADKVDISAQTKIGDIIRKHLPEYAQANDYLEDLEAYLENEKGDLSKDASPDSGAFKNGDRLHFNRCRKIKVQVVYVDRLVELDEIPPAFTLRKVRKLAGKKLDINQNDLKKLRFKRNPEEDFLDFDIHAGSLTTYPSCEVKLYLVEPIKIQGFKSSDLSMLEKHIESEEFQDGIDRQKWSLAYKPDETFPELFIKMNSPQGEFTLKINVEGYPTVAPKGRLWDLDQDKILEVNKRPVGIENQIAFRMEYGNPTSMSLYIPCDRGGMKTHPDWRNKYPIVWWKPTDSIFKYVNFVYNLLNDE